MKAEIEKLKSSLAEKDEKINALNSEKEKAIEVINKIKMLQSSAAGSETKEKPGKGETKTERPLAGAIAKLRKVK